ncbi:gamma-butyrobetaine dioxygenase-like [Acanthaster planci]|uniref:Gamma-butyrobetaine dioxygenase-like n=1 Tax=Acanthaster planci TaxID=133434 RepID=A0A8B7XPA9_ACAPL|nr:gamma-butyrobetaine dioxygenase-like [Acanthaster planci]
MAASPRLTSVTRDDSTHWYRLAMDSGYEGTYPYVWLRDNCRCSECFSPAVTQRKVKMGDTNPDIKPSSESIVADGKVLRITWPNQHLSEFDAAFLNRQRFSEMQKDAVSCPKRQSWGADLNGRIPTFDFQKLLQDDLELYNWLDVLNTKGLAVVKGAPAKKGTMLQLAEKVAYMKKTSYGDTCHIFSTPTAERLMYSHQALPLHVDQPYMDYAPGIEMLQCIQRVNVHGGESQFVDGMRLAEQLKEESPKAYYLLTTREVDFETRVTCYDWLKPFHMKKSRPTIQLDKHGEFQAINYDTSFRSPSMSQVPVGEVADIYGALKLLFDIMYRPENVVHYLLAEGEMATFDNRRLLHARTAFTISGEGGRLMECGYLDWDEARSRMRILQESLGL